MSCDKVFELSAVEVLYYNIITVCVYTVGEFYTFLPKLEVVINKVQVTNK
jgi:hypothetical protein